MVPCRTLVVVGVVLSLAWSAGTARGQAAAGASLNKRVPDVNFSAVALADAIEYVRDTSAANIHVNWRALEEIGISKDTPVNLRLRGAPLRKVLTLILTEAAGGADALTFYTADGVIEVTTRALADQDLVTRIYPVQDLLVEVPDFNDAPDFNLQQQQSAGRGGGGGQSIFSGSGGGGTEDAGLTRAERADQLIRLIVDTIQPDVWADNGGTATIRFFNGNLVVRAPRSVHEALGGPTD
jgi:hypothetical protein